jgi:hypothetical protein
LEFARQPVETEMGDHVLYTEGEQWSEEYIALTQEFYLNI